MQSASQAHELFDLAVIGGGINGVAIARDAALRGLKTILFEKGDFAGGTSSKSSKLIHGGLRYLQNFQFKIVRESLQERSILMKTASNLVHPLPFVIPLYQGMSPSAWMTKLGLTFYDFFSRSEMPPHSNLSLDNVLSLFPFLKKDHLQGGCLYYDAQMQDNRLVIENMREADSLGALLLNYTEVIGLLKSSGGKVGGVRYKNTLYGSENAAFAKSVVNATGSWTNSILSFNNSKKNFEIYPTKGVHLVLPPLHPTHALLLTAPQDNRFFFLIPWNGYSLLGTTDTPYGGDLEAISVLKEDEDYLLQAISHYFPNSNLSRDSIVAKFAGLRPLLKKGGAGPSRISRDYLLDVSSTGLITLVGGKYTTYRLMAEKTVDAVLKYLGTPNPPFCSTKDLPLCSFAIDKNEMEKVSLETQLPLSQVERIVNQYGKACYQIFEIISNSPQEGVQICPCHPHLYAELVHAIQHEKAVLPADWFERRTSIACTACGGKKCAAAVAKKFEELYTD